MEGAEFTENIINGVERPVKAAELFAFTLRVRAGNTDVLTDAEENVSVSCAYTQGKRSEERFSRNAETDLVCRLLLEKKNATGKPLVRSLFRADDRVSPGEWNY